MQDKRKDFMPRIRDIYIKGDEARNNMLLNDLILLFDELLVLEEEKSEAYYKIIEVLENNGLRAFDR